VYKTLFNQLLVEARNMDKAINNNQMTSESFNSELRADLDIIGRIITNISLHLDFLDFLYNSSTNSDREVFNTYPLFWHLRNSYWSVSILDLHKIFSKSRNDNYSLASFSRKLIDNYNIVNWKRQLTSSKLGSIEEEITANKSDIEKLKKVRDQYIAHLDRKREKVDLKIDELKKLLFFSQNLYNEFNLSLNNASTVWNFTWSEKGYQVLRNLYKFQKIREITQDYRIRNQDLIEVNKIMKIIREDSAIS
jgi:hypothetical protein